MNGTSRSRREFAAIALAVSAAIAMGNEARAQQIVAELDEIQVTASRIRRDGFEAPTPTTIVGMEQIEARAAVRVSQVLFDLPALRPTATAVPFSASAGGSYANLRSLNPGAPTQTATRTLVLVDGRRVVPSTATGLVDLNAIPTSLIERAEIVTGGASAAWGSDAVAGVVNFLLKKKLDGFEGTAQYGISDHGDFNESFFSAAWGTGYASGRGQVMLSAEYSDLSNIATYGDRAWGRDQYGWVSGVYQGRNVTRITVPGVVASGVSYGGVIVAANGGSLGTTTSPLRGIQFGPGGSVLPFYYGTYLSTNQMVGGSGPVLSKMGSMGAPVGRRSAYGRTTFDFTDNVSGFAEVSYAKSTSIVDTQPSYLPNGDPTITIQRDNAFLPQAVRDIMVANNITSFAMGRVLPEFGEYSMGASGTSMTRFGAGLEGKFGADWKWNAYVGAGSTDYYDRALNNINEPNWRAALDTVVSPNGVILCRVNSTNSADVAIVNAPNYQGRGAASGCMPANPFGPNSLSQQVVDYVVGISYAEATIKQQSAGASLQGEPFSTWAGKVSVAGGFDYRKDSVDQIADQIAQATTPAFQTGSWQFATRRPLKGSYDVKELFAETVIPLAKDMTLLQALELNAAVRTANYSSSGSVTSWKAGLSYEPGGGLRLRSTRSRDIRAPNLVEMFTQGVSIVGAVVDYGRPGNPSVSVATTTLGNPDLKPEHADTTTIGLTWRPAYVNGFGVSVDYYEIDLKDAIGSLGGQNIVNACYSQQQFFNAPPQPAMCDLIVRDPTTNVISNINNRTLNLAFTNTKGVDLELDYRFALERVAASLPGNLSLRLLGTHLDSQRENNGIVTVPRAGQLGLSKWRLTGNVTWDTGPLAVNVQLRYIDAANIDNTYGPDAIDNNRVPSYFYTNASVQYTLFDSADRGRLQVFGNINNLFDKDPPRIPSSSAAPAQTTLSPDYDKIGRYYALGLRYHF
jgi:outer membrane receptor protein involved in Fe transport